MAIDEKETTDPIIVKIPSIFHLVSRIASVLLCKIMMHNDG